MESRSLGNLVVRLALELAQYKAGWKEAEDATREGAAKVDQANQAAGKSSGLLQEALKRQAGAYGEVAGGALEYAQAAQAGAGASTALAVGVGATVAVLGALAYAAYKGNEEQRKLNDSLILTGNYAGLVTGQLDQMALSMASNIGGTVGNAREVLTGLAGTGRFTVESLGDVGEAVQLVARFSRKTNEDVLKDFAGMADGVAKWAEKHNEAYHFLDLETYRYIKRLEEQDRTQEAIRVTSEALSKHLGGDMTQNLGLAERAWLALQRAASGAWSAMKDIGKDQGIDAQIAAAARRLESAKAGLGARSASGQDAIAAQETELRTLMRRKELLDSNAQAQTAKAQTDERAIKADKEWGELVEKNKSRQERMNDELRKARENAALLGISGEKLAEQERLITARYADKAKHIDEAAAAAEKERRLVAELSGVTATYMQDLTSLSNARAAGNLSEERYIELVKELIARQPAARKQIQEMAKEAERLAKASEAAAKAHEAWVSELSKGIDKLQQEIDKQREHNAALGLSKEAIAELEAAKLEEQATSLEGIAIRKYEKDLDDGLYDMRMREAAQYRELARLKREGAGKEAGLEAAKETAKAWKETGDFIEHTLLDAVRDGLREGESFSKAFFKSLEATAKTTVLRFGVQFAGQGITAMLGGPTAAQGAGGAVSSASNAYGMYNAGSGVVNAFMSGYSGAAAVGTGASFASTVGAGLATDAMGATVIEGAAAAGIETGIGAGVSAGLAAIPVAGWIAIAGMALYSIFGGEKGGPKGNAFYATPGMTGVAALPGEQDPQLTSAAQLAVNTITGAYKSAAEALGIQAGNLQVAIQANTDPKGDSLSHLAAVVSLNGRQVYDRNNLTNPAIAADNSKWEDIARDPAAMPAEIELAIARGLLSALQASELKGKVAEYFKSIDPLALTADQVNASITAATNAQQLYNVMEKLGPAFSNLSNLSVEAASQMVTAEGGAQASLEKWADYYNNFTTDAQKRADTIEAIVKTLNAAGLDVTAEQIGSMSREGFASLMQAQAARGAAGEQAVNALLNAESAFASITPAANAAAEAAGTLEQRLAALRNPVRTLDDIASGIVNLERAGASLRVQLLTAQGDTAGAAALQRELDTAGMTEAELAIYNYNESVRAQIQTLNDATAAADAAAAAAEAVGQQRLGLENELLQLQGNTDELRRRQLAAMPQELRQLQLEIWATQDARDAAGELAQANRDAADASRQAADTARQAWDVARGNTDAAYAALERAVGAQRDAAQLTVQLAQEQVSQLKGLFDLLKGETRSLYGEVDSTAAQSVAAGRRFIAQALATAQASGYLPDESALSDAIGSARAGMGSGNYATKLDFDRDRLVLAGQLSKLRDMSGDQLTTAEHQLLTAQNQVDSLNEILKAARTEIDVMRGIDGSVQSVAQALQGLSSAIVAESTARQAADAASQAAADAANPAAPALTAQSLYAGNPLAVKSPEAANLAYWQAQIDTVGYAAAKVSFDASVASNNAVVGSWYANHPDAIKNPSRADIAWWLERVDDVGQAAAKQDFTYAVANITGKPVVPVSAFRAGGLFGGGARVVGEAGPELEITGPSRIFSFEQTRSLLAGANSADPQLVVRLTRALDEANNILRAIAHSSHENSKNTEELVDRGIKVQTTPTTPVYVNVVATV